MNQSALDRLIVALDFPNAGSALALVDRLEGSTSWFKVGLELYIAEGNSLVAELKRRGCSVFLDLKLHDIPNTVAGAVGSAARLGVDMLTVHAGGGPAMLEAAAAAAEEGPDLLAVTVLTSMDHTQLEATGIQDSPSVQVERLATMALNCGVEGIVCSPVEISNLRRRVGSEPLLVIPGIRPEGTASNDQRRIATPAAAIASGASYLVVGRPITQAANPFAAAQAILAEMQMASV
jgi:orotidine-5'-phosphate decarboxylase